ncbi:TIGR02530 family flagellar biosynthesis protein [Bacillota bacterium LX-D]|nr:TIGR02530 family flagellar biosynthesis protein [Bacillota bacterium LX-D]
MVEKVDLSRPILPIEQLNSSSAQSKKNSSQTSFKEVFNKQLHGEEKLHFSKHAQERLESREIKLSETDLQKITAAIDKAKAKGARESLLLLNNLALIVSVKNNTVVTALDNENMKNNVFTNIDSAVIL